MKKLIFLFLLLPTLCYGQTKADILTTSTVMLGTDAVRFMPNKLVSVDTSGAEVKTYIEPKIEFSKWTNPTTGIPEETLTLEIPSLVGYTDKTVDSATGEVVMRNKTEGVYFRKPADSNDIIKYGLILYETPKNTQTWEFNLRGYENFNLFYQAPLANINKDGSTWEIDPQLGRSDRPAEISGSYAVYHKTKKDHILGGMNYETGKFGHILRPKLIDANNNFLGWIDLNIENGRYRLSISNISQSILDNATLPLRFNDTFGKTTSTGTSAEGAYAIASKATSGGSAGTLTKVTHWHNANDTLENFIAFVYLKSDASLVAYSSAQAGANVAWLDYAMNNEAISASTDYIVGLTIGSAGGGAGYKYDSGAAGDMWYSRQSYSSPPENPWAGYSTTGRIIACYATYTPSGGATPRRRIIIISKNDIHETSTNSDRRLGDCIPGRKKVFA